MKNWHAILFGATFVVTAALASNMDYNNAVEGESLYCSMVAQWDADAAAGVPKQERAGWPPYQGRSFCEEK